jgi:CspA family cold shock protein
MATGTVKWFNSQKGYGFIRPSDGGGDVSVHISAVLASSLDRVVEGDKLSYEVQMQRGKPAAINLRLAE